jgi:hypothetical protein
MSKNDNQALEDGKKVTIEAKTRAEATEKVNALRKQADDKGLKAIGGFVIYDHMKEDEGKNPFSATLSFIDSKND